MNCQTCKHWRKLDRLLDERGNAPHASIALNEDNRAGECRCKPPISALSTGGGFRAFPITRGVDGCGEWENLPTPVLTPQERMGMAENLSNMVRKRGRPKKLVDVNDNVK